MIGIAAARTQNRGDILKLDRREHNRLLGRSAEGESRATKGRANFVDFSQLIG
jgi:hypothetical protein